MTSFISIPTNQLNTEVHLSTNLHRKILEKAHSRTKPDDNAGLLAWLMNHIGMLGHSNMVPITNSPWRQAPTEEKGYELRQTKACVHRRLALLW